MLGIIALGFIGCAAFVLRNYTLDRAVIRLKNGDGASAVQILKPLAYIGDKIPECLLGNIYAYGAGNQRKSDADAIYWFRRCGSFGLPEPEKGVDPLASYELDVAKTYASGGQGVKADPVESLKWLTLAARDGSKEATAILAKSRQ
ncbi:MAG: hypothetical protein P4L95_20775 [Rouxiella aceris]|uniref:hypothetical protein n=1 Tax=Rouxiella aceris TaxID=2703884 RepID=UPI0028427554|nr:hypothetical protein [Rouxiella aceris]MDR3434300.1 hypothetical protein [Rouxiella aceris]